MKKLIKKSEHKILKKNLTATNLKRSDTAVNNRFGLKRSNEQKKEGAGDGGNQDLTGLIGKN